MRLLELFSGTKSVSKAVEDMYDEVISVDILHKFKPTEVADILDWDYTKYPPGHFDAIWASPPCNQYSKLRTCSKTPPNIALANRIVQRTIEIIDYFNPDKWFMENPQTGTLKDQEFMQGIPYYDVDYCRYADWGYRKRTRIWTCVDGFNPLLCLGKNKCPQMIPNTTAHKVSNGNRNIKSRAMANSEMLYRIPSNLVRELFSSPG